MADENERAQHRTSQGRVLAVIGRAGRAEAVLSAGIGLARALGADLQVLHIDPDGRRSDTDVARRLASGLGVPLEVQGGGVAPTVLDETVDADVRLTVTAADAWDEDPTAAGATVRSLLEDATGPVVLLPPPCSPNAADRYERLLVPHDGAAGTAHAIADTMAGLRDAGVEVVLLHVVDDEHTPWCIDQVRWGVETWRREFLARHGDPGCDLVLCSGDAVERILAAVHDHAADLVLLGWSQDLSEGRADVVRALLQHAPVPIVLTPVDAAAPPAPSPAVVPVGRTRPPTDPEELWPHA